MTSVSGWAEGAKDQLPSSLVFKIPSQSTAVNRKVQTEWFPSGASQYAGGSGGIRTMRFNISDPISWLAPESVYLKFTVQNDTAVDIVMAAGAHCFIERVRIFAAGVPIEEITNFSKLIEMVNRITPSRKCTRAKKAQPLRGCRRLRWVSRSHKVSSGSSTPLSSGRYATRV